MVEEAQFESIFTELQKIQKLEQANVQLRDMVDEQKGNLDEVKTKLGLDESDDKSNVVGGDDAPSRLTSNERSRYKNIGKAFIDGAGQAFKKIQKAIKFKENMSTIKEKFFGGIDKIKTGVKNAFGTGKFWKNLMKIVGLLSVIIYLYREKISKNFPNLTQGVRDLFGGLKDFFGGLVVNIFDFVSTGIAQSFNKLFSNALIYIPKIIDTFFGYTLPTAITNLYLEVLSLYGSESAQQHLDKRMDENIEKVVDNVESSVSDNLNGIDSDFNKDFLRIQKLMGEHPHDGIVKVGEQEEFQELSENAGVVALLQQQGENYDIIIQSIQKKLNDNQFDIGEMMKRNQIDMTVFASLIKKFSEDNKLTKGEVLTAVQNSITDTIFADSFKESFENLLSDNKIDLNQEINAKEKNAFSSFIETYTKNKNDYAKAAEKSRQLQDKYEIELENQKKKFQPVVIEITSDNVGKIISDVFLKETSEVITSISNFLKGDVLKNSIIEGFKKLGDFYNKFFDKSIILLNNALISGSTALQQIIDKGEKIKQAQLEGTSIEGQEQQMQQMQQTTTNTINYGSDNVIVNVNLSNVGNDVVGTLIGQLNDKDIEVVTEIEKSNEHLKSLLTLVKNINSITGVSEQQFDNKCIELEQKINKLKQDTGEITLQTTQQITDIRNVLYDMSNSNGPVGNNITLQVTGFAQ